MALCLRVDVPVCGFRPFTARDYQQTYPAPPPATVFGMLLSLVGCEMGDAQRFHGVRMAVAMDAEPPVTTILRKMRRDAQNNPGTKKGIPQYRPEYQELMTDLALWCLIVDAPAPAEPLEPLIERALHRPVAIERYGAVSLGESTFLVDSIRMDERPDRCIVLRPEPQGGYAMPIWVDHGDRSRTRLHRFSLVEGALTEQDAVRVGPD